MILLIVAHRASSSRSASIRATSNRVVANRASSSKLVRPRELVLAVFAGGWLVQAALAMNTGQCVESSQAGDTQVIFQNRLDFGFFMMSADPPPAFQLRVEDGDDRAQKWFHFSRNEKKKTYTISTLKASMSIPVVGNGWKNWTLSVYNERLLLVYNNNHIAFRRGPPARPDVCYRLNLHKESRFQHKFCYPDESNQCVITATSSLEMTTKTPETTTTEAPSGTTTTEDLSGTTTNEDPSETTTNEDLSGTTTNEDPSETTTNEDPSETTTNEDPSETTTNEDLSGTTTNEDLSGTTTTPTPHISKTHGTPSASKVPEMLRPNTLVEKEHTGERTSAGHTAVGKQYILIFLLLAWLVLRA